jgi:hypothetical protein
MNCCNRRCRQGRECPLNLEEADAPVSTPQAFNWPTLAITFALCAALAVFVFGVWSVIWPLFLAAVK